MMIGPTVAVAALAFADSGGMGGMSGRKMGGSGMFDIADHRSVFVTGLGMGGMMVGSGGLERGLSAIALAPGEEAVRIERTVPHSPQVKRELGLIARVVAKFAINAVRHNPRKPKSVSGAESGSSANLKTAPRSRLQFHSLRKWGVEKINEKPHEKWSTSHDTKRKGRDQGFGCRGRS
jgi:hypothetical protein